ncbi:putative acyltransferase [Smittium mucronatum]|uniref:Putative acyltransferase n=1 Tax=Smittium mucronatum TaxID=133383 RepID=A0A1R0GPI0_9FUNG|nr:putative acyltransferase [Smittium mucronatum]
MEYLVYDIIRFFWIQIVSIFFREIAQGNAHSIPKEGPVIFVVAPHNNQTCLFPDRRFLSQKKYHWFLWPFAPWDFFVFYLVPVERAMDHKIKGLGTITYSPNSENPLQILGLNSKFSSQFNVGDRISISNGKAQHKVTKIVSDTELLIDFPVTSTDALTALASEGGCPYDSVPALDQNKMYKAVYDRLNANECIGIFPEGGSHDQSKMLPLKIGVCLMALGASAANPNLKINIVPAGLNYFHPSKFRSRAVIEFGNPIPIDPELVEKFKQGGAQKREASSALLDTISEALKQVTLNTPDSDTMQLIHTCRRLYNPSRHSISMRDQVELSRRFVRGYMKLKDDPEVSQVIERVMDYKKELEYLGIRDHQVSKLHMNRFDALALLVWRLIWLLLTGSVALSGAILNLPIFIIAKTVASIKAKQALAASTVKLKANDVVATWKVLVALVFIPTLYNLYALLYAFYARDFVFLFFLVPSPNSSFIFCYMQGLILATVISMASLSFGERAMDILKSLKPLIAVIANSDDSTKKIIAEREDLSNTITQLVNELGPQLYPEYFNKVRKSEDQKNDSSLRKRNSNKGDKDTTSDDEKPTASRFSIPSITPKFLSSISSVSSIDFLGTGTSKRRLSRKYKGIAPPADSNQDSSEIKPGYLSRLFNISNMFQVDWFGNSQDSNMTELADYKESLKYSNVFTSTDEENALSSASHSRNSSFDSSSGADISKTLGMSPLTPADK